MSTSLALTRFPIVSVEARSTIPGGGRFQWFKRSPNWVQVTGDSVEWTLHVTTGLLVFAKTDGFELGRQTVGIVNFVR